MDQTPPDLSLVSTDDLTVELAARFNHFAFVGMQEKVGPETHGYYRRWAGNSHTVIGLLVDLQDEVLKAFKKQCERPDPDDAATG